MASSPRERLKPGARILVSALVLGVAAGACAAPSTPRAQVAGPTITIGSPGSTEQTIVAQLYAGVLEHAGASVTVRTDLGARSAVEPALASGQLDLYPDYAGELLLFLAADKTVAATRITTAVADLKDVLGAAGATVLRPAAALDTDVFVVMRATAQQYHLTTLSSLQPVASKLVLGGPPGCQSQSQCEAGLQSTYGLHFKSFTSLDDAGPVTVAALKGGEVQVAPLSSSDGTAVRNNFVALTDDKHLLNADYVIPVIRNSMATRAVRTALDSLSVGLSTDDLAQLNIEVTFDHEAPRTVAQRWLVQHHLI
jgi:osmoprotectant transport system substrate-binding protein